MPPLSLYVHVPWCRRKCPYCDFNSYEHGGRVPEAAYLEALLRDLAHERARLQADRPLTSIFIGGGTPSLLSGATVAALLSGIRDLFRLTSVAEITLEANPGAAEARRFAAYREAGVNRLSIGAQSFAATPLRRLGRIHDPRQVRLAVAAARAAGFANINLDLMYGLPGQSLKAAAADLEAAIALEPEHLSYYQLTLEPNTPFARQPPRLPSEELIADQHLVGAALLASAGFEQYEVSAFASPRHRCRHNLNYWRFGDYLGIGAGAHGKLTDARAAAVWRYRKHDRPEVYLAADVPAAFVAETWMLGEADAVLEFMMNALRLVAGFPLRLFSARTGMRGDRIAAQLEEARRAGLLSCSGSRVAATPMGRAFLNDLLQYFVPTAPSGEAWREARNRA